MNATGIILAGGKSSRMGQDKALLQLEGETLISRSIRELKRYVNEVIIVDNQQDKYPFSGVKRIKDNYQGLGPLAGIQAGLRAARGDYAFIMACDMPFFDGKIIKLLINNSPGFQVVVPRIHGYLEPLCALYAKSCLPIIENNIEKKNYKIVDIYSHVRVEYLNEAMFKEIADPYYMFANINTYEEYRKVCPLQLSSS